MLNKILIFLGRFFGYTTTTPHNVTMTEVNALSHVIRIYNNNDKYIDLEKTYLEFSGKNEILYYIKLKGLFLEPYQKLVLMGSNNPIGDSPDTIYVKMPLLVDALDNSLHVRIIHYPSNEMTYGSHIIHKGEML